MHRGPPSNTIVKPDVEHHSVFFAFALNPRWSEEARELTGRTDGNKRVVFPDRGVIDGLERYRAEPNASRVS